MSPSAVMMASRHQYNYGNSSSQYHQADTSPMQASAADGGDGDDDSAAERLREYDFLSRIDDNQKSTIGAGVQPNCSLQLGLYNSGMSNIHDRGLSSTQHPYPYLHHHHHQYYQWAAPQEYGRHEYPDALRSEYSNTDHEEYIRMMSSLGEPGMSALLSSPVAQELGQPTVSMGGAHPAAAHNRDAFLVRVCAQCKTVKTPLWRNGPQGPKSLCNACGIRYKKEERRSLLSSLMDQSSSTSASHGVSTHDATNDPAHHIIQPYSSSAATTSPATYEYPASSSALQDQGNIKKPRLWMADINQAYQEEDDLNTSD